MEVVDDVDVLSTLEIFLSMCYINLYFTYVFTCETVTVSVFWSWFVLFL